MFTVQDLKSLVSVVHYGVTWFAISLFTLLWLWSGNCLLTNTENKGLIIFLRIITVSISKITHTNIPVKSLVTTQSPSMGTQPWDFQLNAVFVQWCLENRWLCLLCFPEKSKNLTKLVIYDHNFKPMSIPEIAMVVT